MLEAIYSLLRVRSPQKFIPLAASVFSSRKMEAETPVKPPNVLVYTGESENAKFNNILDNLQCCLNPDFCLIYHLKPSQVNQHPWQGSLRLLIVSSDDVDETVATLFESYVRNGGKLLVFGSKLSLPGCTSKPALGSLVKTAYKDFNQIVVCKGKYAYEAPDAEVIARGDSGRPLITKITQGGTVIASEIHLELDPVFLCHENEEFSTLKQHDALRLAALTDILVTECKLEALDYQIPKYTIGYVTSKSDSFWEEFKKIDGKVTGKGFKIVAVEKDTKTLPEASSSTLPVQWWVQTAPFDRDLYFSYLKSNSFGHSMVFSAVLGTTMVVSKHLSEFQKLVVIAGRQLEGQGRSGNKWISPEGCAMFTINLSVPMTSPLGQKLTVIQHLASLAMVHAIRRRAGYENLDLQLKWPNDVYFGNKIKIGGVVVDASIEEKMAKLHIGCGLNIANHRPTLCVNDIIKLHNSSTGSSLSPLSVEEVIAGALTELESLIDHFEAARFEKVLELYYTYWLHANQSVSVPALNADVSIIGLDDYGFLLVETKEGKKVALQPDGNTFDLMKNLIVVKQL